MDKPTDRKVMTIIVQLSYQILNFSGKSTTSGPLENMHSSAKREKKQLNILLMVNKLWFKSCTLVSHMT